MSETPSADRAPSNRAEGTFAIRVDFLTRPALADTARRGEGLEWPPHPHRLFAAMAAAHYEAGVGRRETLEWLEALDPPDVSAPEVDVRTSGSFFVPVNDRISDKALETVLGKSSPDQLLADRRLRQERTFAVGSLLPRRLSADGPDGHRSVYYVWRSEEEPPPDLDDVLREVTRLGHSSSMVTACLWGTETPPVTLVAAEGGAIQLRVPEPGTLARLDELHEVRQLSTRQQDQRGPALEIHAWAGYRRVEETAPATGPWPEHWVWTLEPRISVTAWIHLAEAIRGTLLRHLPPTAAGVLTGHGEGNHLAVVPLPHVGHPKADATVLGFAVLSPRLDGPDRESLLLAMAELRRVGAGGRLVAGAAGAFHAEPLTADDPRRTLHVEEWARPSRSWATVTPMVLDHFPKNSLPMREVVAGSAERLGLPAPAEVVVQRQGTVAGTPPSWDFLVRRPAEQRRDHRPWSHAVLRWDRPVAGPIVLGALRHFGLGLCRPLPDPGAAGG